MAALLTYRSRNSFESRFGRKLGPRSPNDGGASPRTKHEEHSLLHNDGSKLINGAPVNEKYPPTYFSAQSYMRYNGSKFINRFDANCYIAISRKLILMIFLEVESMHPTTLMVIHWFMF